MPEDCWMDLSGVGIFLASLLLWVLEGWAASTGDGAECERENGAG